MTNHENTSEHSNKRLKPSTSKRFKPSIDETNNTSTSTIRVTRASTSSKFMTCTSLQKPASTTPTLEGRGSRAAKGVDVDVDVDVRDNETLSYGDHPNSTSATTWYVTGVGNPRIIESATPTTTSPVPFLGYFDSGNKGYSILFSDSEFFHRVQPSLTLLAPDATLEGIGKVSVNVKHKTSLPVRFAVKVNGRVSIHDIQLPCIVVDSAAPTFDERRGAIDILLARNLAETQALQPLFAERLRGHQAYTILFPSDVTPTTDREHDLTGAAPPSLDELLLRLDSPPDAVDDSSIDQFIRVNARIGVNARHSSYQVTSGNPGSLNGIRYCPPRPPSVALAAVSRAARAGEIPIARPAPVTTASMSDEEVATYLATHGTVGDAVTPEQRVQVLDLLVRHRDAFRALKTTKGGCTVDFGTREGTPRHIATPRPVHPNLEKAYRAELRRLVDEDVLEGPLSWRQVQTDLDFASPAHIVEKRDETAPATAAPYSGGIRITADCRKLNEHLDDETDSFPVVESLLQRIQNATWFTRLDLTGAFWALNLSERAKRVCGVVTPFGIYKHNRLPQGAKPSPGLFKRKMEQVLAKQIQEGWVLVYADDILILSNGSLEDHLRKVDEVLQTLTDAKLVVSLKKSVFATKRVSFLGQVIERGCRSIDPARLHGLERMPMFSNLKECQSFIGLANYHQIFVPLLQVRLAPLYMWITQATAASKNRTRPPPVTDRERAAFNDIKQAILEHSVLALPNPTRAFTLQCDAATHGGCGGAVYQHDEHGRLRPVAYYSHKWTDVQTRYTVGEQELLAILLPSSATSCCALQPLRSEFAQTTRIYFRATSPRHSRFSACGTSSTSTTSPASSMSRAWLMSWQTLCRA